MNISDPIADLLTRIRNAQHARQAIVQIPASKVKIAITHILKHEGFVKAYKCVRDNKQGLIKIALRYEEKGAKEGAIESLRRVSRPGRRVYVRSDRLPTVRNGQGVAILSTSKGLMTVQECKKTQTGGKPLFLIK